MQIIALNSYIRKEERSKKNDLFLPYKKKKKEYIEPKEIRIKQ
jgi:hypothetical protein